MKKFIIAANWKMNGSRVFVENFLTTFISQPILLSKHIQFIIFPPFIYLPECQKMCKGHPVALGGQTLSEYESGAYTGEISAAMLKDIDCQYVLVGHSERRTLYNESNFVIAKKFKTAKAQGLIPVLCVGETLAQREQGLAMEVIQTQLLAVFEENGERTFDKAIIAYEPVWAIGTGKTATEEEAQEIHSNIRQYVAQLQPEVRESLQILYGGSVKPENIEGLAAMKDIDGALVGGASLDVEQLIRMGQRCPLV